MNVSLRRSKNIALPLFCMLMCSTVLAAKKPNTPQTTCATKDCHTVYSTKAFVHGPVELGDCKSCHKPLDSKKHTFEFIRKGQDLCGNCHLDQATGKNIHEPVKSGDCTQCHDPHSSDNKFMLTEKTVAGTCENCHQVTSQLQYLHGPAAIGECTMCHDSHSSDHEKLLVEDSATLCFSCHTITQQELEKFEFIHAPAQSDCIGCHSGHGADNPMMLKDEAPQLCFSCHEEIEKIATTSACQHGVVTKPDGCMMCHTPHASNVEYILKSDPASLCMSCHDKAIGISEDEVLGAFKELKDKKFMHGPVAQNNCNGCHLVHGSEHFRLLEKEYPPQFYAPYKPENYELCFSCHQESLSRTEKTTKLTDFRNGRINMHYLHVNKTERGRTCRSCHQTHASNLPKHIRASVPYGKWELPVNFSKTKTGGSCAPGCHRAKDYDRDNPVDYAAEAKKFKELAEARKLQRQKKAEAKAKGESETVEKAE